MCCSLFFFSSRRRHTRFDCDWSSDVCSSDLFGTLEGLMDADERAIQQVPDVGPGVAAHVAAFFASDEHRRVIKALTDKGVKWPDMARVAGSAGPQGLAGRTAVITGTLASMSRAPAQ